MDISYLRNNYGLIINQGFYYYDDLIDCYFPLNLLENDSLKKVKESLLKFKNEEGNMNSFYEKVHEKLGTLNNIGPYWHFISDVNCNNEKIIRIIIDNAQIFTDIEFKKIIVVKKALNKKSFKKYKKERRNKRLLVGKDYMI
jgi:hypothetical protein